MQNSYLFLFISSNSCPNLILNCPSNLAHLVLSAIKKIALPDDNDYLSFNSFLISSVINLSSDDLNVISSFTFM